MLRFKQPAGTSRGVYTEHRVWYVVFRDTQDDTRFGVGECAPLHDLSCDYDEGYEERLRSFCRATEEKQEIDRDALRDHPSVLFGLETAMRHYLRKSWQLWNTPFSKGEEGIAINGLIWMADYESMLKQIEAKIEQGFHCIKLKIGAIGFERELDLLRVIRRHFTAKEITLRVDANGSFANKNALQKLGQLAELDIHSIEQPVRAGQWEEMAGLCAASPLPVALDEELIGVNCPAAKQKLIDTIHPQYLVLKPSLHGGLAGSAEWIELANRTNTGWWITSALESNIGLNCIAQWCATLDTSLPQGLGTGMLYTNNTAMPLDIRSDKLWFDPSGIFPDHLFTDHV